MSAYDPGVAAERTRLSRHRTSLTVVTCCFTVLHVTLTRVGAATGLFLGTSALLVTGVWLHTLSARRGHRGPICGAMCFGVAAAVSAIGAVFLATALAT